MRLMMLVNTLTSVSPYSYENHRAFWAETVSKYKIKDELSLFTFTPPRMSIDNARNIAAQQALRLECDYLFFLDDDVLVPMNTIEELISCNADIAAGLVYIRSYPFDVMAFKKDDWAFFNDLPKEKPPNPPVLKKYVTENDGLIGVGFSCCLIKTNLLRDVPPPWFITGPGNTEDVFFCQKALDTIKTIQETEDKNYPNLTISLNTDVRPGHLLNSEPVCYENVEALRVYYETVYPGLVKKVNEGGRDLEYIKSHLRGE